MTSLGVNVLKIHKLLQPQAVGIPVKQLCGISVINTVKEMSLSQRDLQIGFREFYVLKSKDEQE